MGIVEKIKAHELESFDVFSLKNALELKVFFGNYYEIFKKAYQRFRNVESNERYEYSILHGLISIIEKKIDIYDFSPDNLDKIDDTILATIIDDDKNRASKLIQAFKQPGIKASLKCFTMATNSDGHIFVYESLKTAGNQIGVFYTVLRGMTDASEEFRKYIIPKIFEHQFYRYKSVVESVSMGYDIGYPIDNAKDFITTMLDILSGNFQEYLDTEDAKTAYLILILLRRVNGIAYESFFDKMLNSPLKMQRFLAFFYMSQRRKDKLKLANKYFEQDDLELYAPLLDCLKSYENPILWAAGCYPDIYNRNPDSKTVDLYKSLYPKLLDLWARLPKKNNIFLTTKDIWFSHGVTEGEIVSKIIHMLKSLDDKTFIHHFEDDYYNKLSPSDKLLFINALKDKIKHNFRQEMLNYFTFTGYFSDRYEMYFIENPLSYDEAVFVSNYLKTKKTTIKKRIVENYGRMKDTDRIKIKAFLMAAVEDYKRECAQDIIISEASQKVDIPTVELPKFAIKDLPRGKVQEILRAIRAVILEKKDVEIVKSDGERVLFGTQHYLPRTEEGNTYFADEVNAAIDAFRLSDGEKASLAYFLVEAGRENAGSVLLGDPIDDFWQNYNTVVNSFLDSYVKNYIVSNQTPSLQTEILKRLMTAYGNITEFSKENQDRRRYYSGREKKETLGEKLLKISEKLENHINYSTSDKQNLADMKTLTDYVLAKDGINPLSYSILLSKWWDAGLITEEEIGSFLKCRLFAISDFFETPRYIKYGNGNKNMDTNIYNGKFTEAFVDIIECIQIEMLETEILRAQAETPYTAVLEDCEKYVGIKFYIEVLKSFQKMTLPRAAYGTTKDNTLARILERVEPYRKDTYESFCTLIKESKLSQKDLIKGVLYNNNQTVLDWTAKYINKNGFVSCVMFFKAHLRDTEVSASVRDRIALYSPIDIADFKEGAVDTNWFFSMKSEIDEPMFDLIYDNGKYITVGNYHKRAQRFSDALTGKLFAKECLDKIYETRNKEFLLCYSLIPLAGDDDIKQRYEVVQKFLLESKQFGAQRQTSEKRSCEIALENIARSAGYEDTNRFIWYMESKEAYKIVPYFSSKMINGIAVSLQINEHFKLSVLAMKDGKELSTMPAKLKSDQYIAEMKAEIPSLNKQSARVIKSLENAMEREAMFRGDELRQFANNPVIKEILKTLFFVSDKKIVMFDGVEFMSLAGTKVAVENVYIAHPLDFFSLKQWEAVQRYLLDKKIRQPFKQAFREFYPKTEDEIGASETNRYHGHQISVQKAIAVAKNRGWHTGEDVGLQKVFYKENIVAVLFGVWDLGYSSFDDHPTISSAYFLNRKADKTGAMKIIPLNEIPDKMFSEVMRDIDLIVSTAHPLGYDFEESLSTVEVRRQICASIIGLLKLSNVQIEGHHLRIKGTYGEYAVNLRSGNAYKQLSGALNIMAINDSTLNKLFLSFVDDNPKTAEVVSKMLLLADDQKIRDPNIVREIKG